jgi:peptide/nickel transport system permease protein
VTTGARQIPLATLENSSALSAWKIFGQLKTNPLIMTGGLLVAIFLVAVIWGPSLSPFEPLEQDIVHAREGPSARHWFGTDELGRDEFSRIMAGARITLVVSLSTLVLACTTGVGIGLATGYFGGRLDRFLMRLVDVQLAIPGLVLALMLVSVMGAGLNSLILAVSVFSYPTFARLTRSVTLKSREEEYVKAAILIGATHTRVMGKHILPNVLPYILSLATVSLGRVVLTISGLGFLGLGLEPGTPEWGMMVSQGRSLFLAYPHFVFFPGAAILLVVLGFNLLGDGLRDYLDPRLRGR